MIEARCDGKFWFYTRGKAKGASRAHNQGECGRCCSGLYRWEVYACTFGGIKHWHVGHRHKRTWAWSPV